MKFEREQGYFLGAMYIGYGLGIGAIALLACPFLLLCFNRTVAPRPHAA